MPVFCCKLTQIQTTDKVLKFNFTLEVKLITNTFSK